MEVICGNTAGFCFGVKRAIDLAKKELKNSNLYCLGEIVHNKDVINELEQMGLKQINNLSEAPEFSSVIFRAHGEKPDTYKEAEKRNLKIIDLTCPKVKNVHKIAEKYCCQNAFIVITGERKHPEVIGIKGWSGKNSIIIENEDDARKLDLSSLENILLISQTTFSTDKFEIIKNILLSKNSFIKIENTICLATQERQEETKKISELVDCMIIIGGKNSSNTKKLFEISQEFCQNVTHIEDINELDIKLIPLSNKIGIMAGASTPPNVIKNVIDFLENL